MVVNNNYNTKTQNLKEKTHSFDVDDVIKYGSIEKALIMKEIKSISLYKIRHGKDGWVYYSRSALAKKFFYMKERSIGQWLDELEREGHLLSKIDNKFKFDKTKSYLPKEFERYAKEGEKDEKTENFDDKNEDINHSSANDVNTSAKFANDIGKNCRPIPSHTPHTYIYSTYKNCQSYKQTNQHFIKGENTTIFICPYCKRNCPAQNVISLTPKVFLCLDCYQERKKFIEKLRNFKQNFKEKTEILPPSEKAEMVVENSKTERKLKRKKINIKKI